jgi:general secretion pathway protein K
MSSYTKPDGKIRAFALVSVLVLVSVLSLVALEFSQRSVLHLRMTMNYAQSKKASSYAFGGYQAALSLLMNDANDYDGPGDMWFGDLPAVPFGSGFVSVRIEDELARFNVAKLVTEYGFEDKRRATMLSRLFEELAVETSLVNALVDWQDSDDLPLTDGAEAAFYASRTPPSAPRNKPMLSAGEILIVKDFDRDLFFLPPSRRSVTALEELSPLSEYVTVYGEGKFNINTAPVPVLQCLSADMDRSIAEDIAKRRESEHFAKIEDLKEVESVSDVLYDEISSLITVKSAVFRIEATGSVSAAGGEISQTVTAVVTRQGTGVRVVYFNRSL